MSEYDDSEEWARRGLSRSTGGIEHLDLVRWPGQDEAVLTACATDQQLLCLIGVRGTIVAPRRC
jgi:hypothetical protein